MGDRGVQKKNRPDHAQVIRYRLLNLHPTRVLNNCAAQRRAPPFQKSGSIIAVMLTFVKLSRGDAERS